jgi:predicted nucleotidyltransferase
MLLDQLLQMKAVLNGIAEQFGASHLRVFGSVARGEESAESDVDFLVDLPKGYDLFTQRLPLTQKLADILNRKVELIPEHELNAHMRQKILAEAVSL